MEFDYKKYRGHHWDTKALSRVLKEMGCNSLEDALKQAREKVKAEGFKPIETQPEPSSIQIKPSQIKTKPRLPYADVDDTDPPF